VAGDAAVLVPARDPAALADAIGDLVGDRQRRAALATAGRARAAPFTWERCAAATADAYRAVTSG
jgi:glycosyltransferase involved in cell wall biosynthesis